MSQRQRARAKIRKFDHPDLLQVCPEVTEDDDIVAIENEMRKVLKAHYEGVGLAAPQIGHIIRAILVRETFLINPEIKDQSSNVQHVREGCLSYPGIEVEVYRPTSVLIKHRDGEKLFRGFEAAIALHEIEHLDANCKVADIWRTKQP